MVDKKLANALKKEFYNGNIELKMYLMRLEDVT